MNWISENTNNIFCSSAKLNPPSSLLNVKNAETGEVPKNLQNMSRVLNFLPKSPNMVGFTQGARGFTYAVLVKGYVETRAKISRGSLSANPMYSR